MKPIKVAYPKKPKHNGFTLIELIVVLILVAILGVYATFRFSGTRGYIEYTYQHRLISALRTIQTRAMQDTSQNNQYQLFFDTRANNLSFGPSLPDGTAIDFSNDALSSGINGVNGFPLTELLLNTTGLAVSGNFTLVRFNSLGEPVDSNGAAICAAGCVVDFIGQSAASVCIEPLGYVHRGACQ